MKLPPFASRVAHYKNLSWLGIGGWALLVWVSGSARVDATIAPSAVLLQSKITSEPTDFIRPAAACPDRLEELMPLLLRDLPSYANRVIQRSYLPSLAPQRPADRPGTILLAGKPDYEPLPLPPSQQYTPIAEDDTSQVFFSTLERQYAADTIVNLQHHHWLFFTQTTAGWRLVLMLSALEASDVDDPATPPQDTSQGAIAQAIRLWLRDCEAGSITP